MELILILFDSLNTAVIATHSKAAVDCAYRLVQRENHHHKLPLPYPENAKKIPSVLQRYGIRRLIFNPSYSSEKEFTLLYETLGELQRLGIAIEPEFTIFCDWDDCLDRGSDPYDSAELRLIAIGAIYGCLQEETQEIYYSNYRRLRYQEGIEIGYDLLHQSYRQTYEGICELSKLPKQAQYTELVNQLAEEVLSAPPNIFTETPNALKTLQQHGVRLIVTTRGDGESQRRKVRESGVAHYFEDIVVWKTKNAEAYAELIQQKGLHPSFVTVIGDSVSADIEPAQKLKLLPIWVKTGRFVSDGKHQPDGYFLEAESIADVPEIVETIFLKAWADYLQHFYQAA